MERAPRQIVAVLLDQGRYLCSASTMYRLLRQDQASQERRRQRRHPPRPAPQLVARGPRQVWSWDITKLAGPERGEYYCLYVMLDLYSRRVVGHRVEREETASRAKEWMLATCLAEGIEAGQLTIHADRGGPMKSKSVAALLADLGVERSHSRPRVSDDNPYSEAAFKTVKYSPNFPARFESLEEARRFCHGYFAWYNAHHRHSGIALLTPDQVHTGQAAAVVAARQQVLDEAYRKDPQRFVGGPPRHPQVPEQVWINRPAPPAPAPSAE